jgi:hypothetical protein
LDGRSGLVPEENYQPFPYSEADKFQPLLGPPIPVMRPMLAVQMKLGTERWSVRALIDTGAPFTLFDRAAGNALGVDYGRIDARREKHTIAGGEWLAQVEEVELTIPAFGDLRWTTEVGFFLHDWGMPFGILGQFGFLDHWVVSFDFPYSFVIEQRQRFLDRIPVVSAEQQQAIWEWQELGWKGPPPSTAP